ncbi:MAG: right-handed parallel beta-helix repeat-containing protein [Clostridia bacterium]|nr:right-handed parallel beta-helix repeat-containing protein [Clostridia bacterium]
MKHLKGLLSVAAAVGLCLACASVAGAAPQKATAFNAAYAVNVKDYGAVGDGTTDDVEAIQKAIRAATQTEEEGSIFFPAGTYRLADSLSFEPFLEVVFDTGAKLMVEKNLNIRAQIVAGDQILFEGKGNIVGTAANDSGNPVWFGAKGDGVTDDTLAFERTINMFKKIDIPYREAGYVISNLELKGGAVFQGADPEKKAKLIATEKTKSLLTISSSYTSVRNLTLEMGKSKYGTGIYFDDNKSGIEQCLLSNIDINDAYNAVRDADHESNMVITTKMVGLHCTNGRNTAIEMNDMWGFIFLTDSVIDFSGSSVELTFPLVFMKDNAGFIGTNLFINGKQGASDAKNNGFETSNSVAVWFDNCDISNVGGCGYKLENNAVYNYLLNCDVSDCGLYGVAVNGWDFQTENLNVKNCGSDGVYLRGGHMQLTNTAVSDCGRNGVTSQASYVQLVSLNTSRNGSFGLSDTGTRNTFTSISGDGNGNGLTSVSEESLLVSAE